MYESIEEFVAKQEVLLKIEQSAEVEEKTTLYSNKSPKVLEKLGLCIRYLYVEQQSTGLYGRFLVVFSVAKSKVMKVSNQQTDCGSNKIKAHQFYPGDIVGVYGNKSNSQEPISTGTVLFVKDNSTTVAFQEEFDTSVVSVYRLMKLTNDVTYKRLKRTLELLLRLPSSSPCRALVSIMFPCCSSPNDRLGCLSKQISFFDDNLDISQQEAVKFVLHTQNLISVIHGPPGTGKTTTIVEVIRQSVKKYNLKILVCAPSNIAVDNIVERLSKTDMKVIRLGHPARALNEVQKFTLDAVLLMQDSSDIIKSVRKDISAMSCKFNKRINKNETHTLRREIKELKRELKNRESKAIQDVLKNADVVLSTTTSASTDGPLKHLPDNYFDLVIIDEAAQAMEASCWIPLLFSKRCILAGDHKQLPPTIISDEAAKDGLSTTLLERVVIGLGENAVCMLTMQYRMNLMIMNWPSLMLYNNKLQAAESVKSHLLCHLPNVQNTADTSVPLVLVDTAGCYFYELEHEDEQSKGNPNEVDIVKEHVENLLLAGVSPKDIGIITPYNLQVELLRQSINQVNSQIEINSVDGFQGREKEAILISMVRSNDSGEVGFLSEDRRINVAITRARRHLFVVCDTQTVSHHKFLAEFCEYMNKNADVRFAKQLCTNTVSALTTNEQFELPFILQSNVLKTLKANDQSSSHNFYDVQASESLNSNSLLSNNKPDKNDYTAPELVITQHGLIDTQNEINKSSSKITLNKDSIMDIIKEFIESPNNEFSFPETLTGSERALVHELAEMFLLEHQSFGKSAQRKIIIKKKIPESTFKPVKQDMLLCETCLSTVPQKNYELHKLRCQKDIKQKHKDLLPQKKEKKTHKQPVVPEDFDTLVQSFAEINSHCSFQKCKKNIKLLGQHCQFCNKTFCLSHHQAEIHGCAEAAKFKARQDMHKTHSHLNNIKKSQLTNTLKKKVTEMEKSRRKKIPEEKQ
ncbi:DNA-binding protein SMUBP-2 isoform X2 [Hydra vulgaris]|uniref:DNA helicase n=1 Tax=Hydra vulgaris TaxID=6087 RepID=A0ABM4BYE2_HYDVU